jgi:hypothetical protein
MALHARFLHTRQPEDLTEALSRFRHAAGVLSAPAHIRITGALRWAEAAAANNDPEGALDAYAVAVELLPVVAWHGVDRSSQEQLLAQWSDLGTYAAAIALAADAMERGVELLDQGRGVLWAHVLNTRTDFAALRRSHPALTVRLDAVRRELNR